MFGHFGNNRPLRYSMVIIVLKKNKQKKKTSYTYFNYNVLKLPIQNNEVCVDLNFRLLIDSNVMNCKEVYMPIPYYLLSFSLTFDVKSHKKGDQLVGIVFIIQLEANFHCLVAQVLLC